MNWRFRFANQAAFLHVVYSCRNLLVGVGSKIDTANARPGSYGNVDIAGSVNEVRIKSFMLTNI